MENQNPPTYYPNVNQPLASNTAPTEAAPAANPVTPPTPVKKSWTKLLVFLTFLITAVVFGGAGYFWGKVSVGVNPFQSLTKNGITQTPAPTPTVEPLTDSTKDWETYTGKEYEFKYPAGLKSDTGAAGANFESIRVQFMGEKQTASGRTQTELFDGYAFIVTKIDSAPEKTPLQWAEEKRAATKETCAEAVFGDINETAIEKGVGVQYKVKNCFADYTLSLIEYNGIVYEITQVYVGEPADQAKYEHTTDLIFNSIKFI
jgi:hypothetical protein